MCCHKYKSIFICKYRAHFVSGKTLDNVEGFLSKNSIKLFHSLFSSIFCVVIRLKQLTKPLKLTIKNFSTLLANAERKIRHIIIKQRKISQIGHQKEIFFDFGYFNYGLVKHLHHCVCKSASKSIKDNFICGRSGKRYSN